MSQTKITKLAPLSLAKVFATYYGFWGLLTGCIYMIQLKEDWYAPIGIWTLFYFVRINMTLHPEPNFLSKAVDLFWLTTYYALTGWLTGLVSAVVYNVCSNFLGLQFEASIESEAGSQTSEQKIL